MSQTHLDDDALAALVPLFRQLVDLKRIRTHESRWSLAERLFRRAWAALAGGEALDAVAHRAAARALVATRLAGVDAGVLRRHGLSHAARQDVLAEALQDAAAPVDAALAERLLDIAVHDDAASWSEAEERHDDGPPPFVSCLRDQPRAGVTYPGKPRLLLTPTESHADHCTLVALLGLLLAPEAGADPARLFLVGLAHHLHNATLPDAGHAGDVLLGDHRAALEENARRRALDQLPDGLRAAVGDALAVTQTYDPPVAQAFHAADALDRVLEIEWHARQARFTMDVALEEYHLVHEGPEQAIQLQALRAAGIGKGERRIENRE